MTLTPVFIGGCDRSGTTMLGDILGNSAGSFATPESQWVHELAPRLHLKAFADAMQAANWLDSNFRFRVWEMKGGAERFEQLIRIDDARSSIEALIEDYLSQMRPDKRQSRVWVDHTPDNVKFYPVLKAIFPDARYIHIVRDGRAVYQSIKALDWGPNNVYSASRYWCQRLDQAIGVELAEGANCLRIRYEDILTEPESTIQRVCEFAGITYSDSMLEGGGVILPTFTHGQHKLVGKRPDASRMESWRKAMSQNEIIEFESYGPTRMYMQSFGYTPDSATAQPCSKFRALWYYLHEHLMYMLNRQRHKAMEDQTVSA